MKNIIHGITLFAFTAIILTACAQTSQQITPASSTPGTTDQTATISENSTKSNLTPAKNLCQVLPASEVSKLTGITFTKTEHKIDNSQNPYITDCFYSNDDAYSVAIIANYDNEGLTAKQQYQQVVDYQKGQEKEFPSTKINDLGEEAFMPSTGILTQINALNKNIWITLSLYNNASATVRQSQAKAIIQKAFDVL